MPACPAIPMAVTDILSALIKVSENNKEELAKAVEAAIQALFVSNQLCVLQ